MEITQTETNEKISIQQETFLKKIKTILTPLPPVTSGGKLNKNSRGKVSEPKGD